MSLTITCGEFYRKTSYAICRPRGRGDWLLIYTRKGGGLITREKRSFTTEPGDAILYAPEEYQDYRTSPTAGEWNLLWTHFTPSASWHAWLNWPLRNGIRMTHIPEGEIRQRLETAFARMVHTSSLPLTNAPELMRNALEEAILWAHLPASDHPWAKVDPRVQKAIAYLIENISVPFSLRQLSAYCGLSVSRMAHLFKATAGVSPQQFLETTRMEHAKNLLKVTNLTIAEIAAETGFADPFYFSTRFKRHCGMNPKTYRKMGADRENG